MKTLLASAAILSLLAAGTAVAGSKMSGDHYGDGPRTQMSDSDHRQNHDADRRGHEEYDDDDREEYSRDRYDDDDREYSDRGQRAFQRMDANRDGVIDKGEFMAHMPEKHRS